MQKGGAVRTYEDIQRLAGQADEYRVQAGNLLRTINRIEEMTEEQLVGHLEPLNALIAKLTERLRRVQEVKRDREKIAQIDRVLREKKSKTAKPDTILDSIITKYTTALNELNGVQIRIVRRIEEIRLEEEYRRTMIERPRAEIIRRMREWIDGWQHMSEIRRVHITERLQRDNGDLWRLFQETRDRLQREHDALRRQRLGDAQHFRWWALNNVDVANIGGNGIPRQLLIRGNNETLTAIKDLKHLPIPTRIFKGFTQGDIDKLKSVFDPEQVVEGYEKNKKTGEFILNAEGKKKPILLRPYRETYATCPVCLKYLDRGAGCLYIQGHDCRHTGDGLYHRELYDKYKTPSGKIVFCAICSRICQNAPEEHLKLVRHDAPRAPATGMKSNPFGGQKECIAGGGGGLKEKIIRYNALRAKALELNAQRGKITEYEAYKQLVEAVWDAPLDMASRKMNLTKFNIPNSAFPTKFENNMNNGKTIIPSNGYETPTILMEGENTVAYTDVDPPFIQLHHLDSDGNMHHHEDAIIGPSGLINWIQSKADQNYTCFSEKCGGYLYPEEVELALYAKNEDGEPYFEFEDSDIQTIKEYRKKFYTNHSQKSEGKSGGGGMFSEMEDGQCTTGGGGAGGYPPSNSNSNNEGGVGGGAGRGGYRRRAHSWRRTRRLKRSGSRRTRK